MNDFFATLAAKCCLCGGYSSTKPCFILFIILSKKTKPAAPAPLDAQAQALNAAIVEAMQNIKAFDIVELDLRAAKDASCDFFFVCTGSSPTHIAGIVHRIQSEVREKLGLAPNHIEGRQPGSRQAVGWMLMDYFTVVVHVFSKQKRTQYNLESLWMDAVQTRHDSEAAPEDITYRDDFFLYD